MAHGIVRLKRRSEFLRVAAKGRKWAAPALVLQAAASDEHPTDEHTSNERPADEARLLRVGFTASKRVGNAVARNRAKRRLRAAVARVMPDRAMPGHDYVVIARAATLTRPFDDLVQDLDTALRRVRAHRSGGTERDTERSKKRGPPASNARRGHDAKQS